MDSSWVIPLKLTALISLLLTDGSITALKRSIGKSSFCRLLIEWFFREDDIALVRFLFHQEFQGTIILMVFDFLGFYTKKNTVSNRRTAILLPGNLFGMVRKRVKGDLDPTFGEEKKFTI